MSKQPAFRRAEPDARRLSLVEACARVLARDGVGGASVRAIALEAGVSAGLVGHYFSGIDALIAATYAHVGEQVDCATAQAVAAAGPDPRARLDAFATASFRAPIADPDLLATWIAFWSLVRSRPAIARQHDEQYAAVRAALHDLLGQCGVAAERLPGSAIAVTALIDGLWLELSLGQAPFTLEEAETLAERWLDSVAG